jgi:hypothetical protein
MLKRVAWTTIQSNAYALVTEPIFGDKISEQQYGNLELNKKEVYIPSKYGIEISDRFEVASGEYYMVESVRKRIYPNVWMCYMTEDNR